MLDMVQIGLRLKKQRKALGFTQQYVYEKLNISQNHYSRIENGHIGMSFDILINLSEILNISIDYILTGKLENPSFTDFLIKYSELSDKQKEFINNQIDCLKKYNLK